VKWLVALLVLVVFVSVVSPRGLAVQSGGGFAQPWCKSCTVDGVGADGCSVTVTMTNSGSSCADSGSEYCVVVSVSCSGSGGDDCSGDANCGVCGSGGGAVGVSCDGQCFSGQPKSGKCWDDVATDCGSLSVRDSGHPCS
jgi:hypothetical protein